MLFSGNSVCGLNDIDGVCSGRWIVLLVRKCVW